MTPTPLLRSALSLALVAGPAAATAQFNTIARESFDYPGGTPLDLASGDLGWLQPWMADCCGGGSSAGTITSPGFDGVGNKATLNVNNEGAFRLPHVGTYSDSVAPNLVYGEDNTTIWVSFTSQRTLGSDSRYGGLSLTTQYVGESLFLGAPLDTNQWGVVGATVSGSSVDVPTRLVYRIDYMAGDERLRMWVNPAVPHPATAPNIDVIVPDHTWNEIRLQAGEGTINNSWEFDNLLLEVQGADPNLYVDVSSISVAAGGTQTMTHALGNQHTGSLYIVLGSLSGTSPGTPFGTATIPLNSDPYLTFTANFVNTSFLTNSFGNLDAIGWTETQFILPPNLSPNLVGLSAHHVLCEVQLFPIIDLPLIFTPAQVDLVP